MITIRFAGTADAELIADISRQTFYDTFAADNTKENMDKFLSQQFSREMLIGELFTPDNIFLLAFEGEEPVGYVRMRVKNNPPALEGANALEIARIYATQSAIGKGVGRSLMQRCIEFAIENKIELIWLGVWEHNERAIRFYTRWGFEKFAEHPFILGDDVQTDWLMKKKID